MRITNTRAERLASGRDTSAEGQVMDINVERPNMPRARRLGLLFPLLLSARGSLRVTQVTDGR